MTRCPGCARATRAKDEYCSAKCRRATEARRLQECAAREDQWQPVALSEPLLARYSGRCAACHTYIRKGQSKIVRVPARVPTIGVFFDAERGCWRDRTSGDPVHMHERAWAHARCAVIPIPEHEEEFHAMQTHSHDDQENR